MAFADTHAWASRTPGTHQGCDVLNEGHVLVRGSEEEVSASRSQDAQEQRPEHDRIQGEVWGCRADICKEVGIEAVGDQVSGRRMD